MGSHAHPTPRKRTLAKIDKVVRGLLTASHAPAVRPRNFGAHCEVSLTTCRQNAKAIVDAGADELVDELRTVAFLEGVGDQIENVAR